MSLRISKIHKNRKGEATGKVTYSFDHKGKEFTRTTARCYLSAAVVERDGDDSRSCKSGKVHYVTFSAKPLDADKAISQAGYTSSHFTSAPCWGRSSAGRDRARKEFEAFKKTLTVTIYHMKGGVS